MSESAGPTFARAGDGRLARYALYAALILGSLLMLLPFLLMLLVSLLPLEAFMSRQFSLGQLTLSNYVETFRVAPFGRYIFNSAVVAVTATVGQMVISSLAAFAFARMRFWGREAIFLLFLATMMIPEQVTLIPRFLIIRELHWYDTFYALIVPNLFTALSVFLLRQYYRGIPLDLDEAARMDGASSLRIWWQVIMPLSWPVLAALTVFRFQAVWNDFLWPLLILKDRQLRTLAVGLATLQQESMTDFGLLMAGSTFAAVPMIIIFFAFQRHFLKGLTIGALKG